MDNKYLQLLEKINIKPKNEGLYIQALSHPSFVNETNSKYGHYQRLEFRGDAVLEMIITDFIFFEYKDMDEGNMSLLRSKLVREETLFGVSKKINLGEYIYFGHGEALSGGASRPSVVSDVFEALICAIDLDLGRKESTKFVSSLFASYIQETGMENILEERKDSKTKLQELVQADTKRTVEYKLIETTGTANNPTFTVEVWLDNACLGIGKGHKKQDAEQNAAKDALEKMVK